MCLSAQGKLVKYALYFCLLYFLNLMMCIFISLFLFLSVLPSSITDIFIARYTNLYTYMLYYKYIYNLNLKPPCHICSVDYSRNSASMIEVSVATNQVLIPLNWYAQIMVFFLQNNLAWVRFYFYLFIYFEKK